MKKTIVSVFVLIALLLSSVSVSGALDDISISAESCVLLDAAAGTVLYEKDADKRMLIASTTKIMTALLVIENCNLEDVVEIKPEYVNVEGSSMYLKAGEKYTVRELLYGMMLASGNDAAYTLACHTAGSSKAFSDLMNDRVKALGLKNTSFENPHGLDGENHYSTSYDLGIIASEAMKNQVFEEIVSTKSIEINGNTFTNHNKLLWNYEYAKGIKTGYTMSAGRSLVSCAEKDGVRLICVTLNDKNDWEDHINLFNLGFENYKSVSVSQFWNEGKVPVISGTKNETTLKLCDNKAVITEKNAEITYEINVPNFVYAPVYSGDKIGKITVYADGEEILSSDILAENTVTENEDLKVTAVEELFRRLVLKLKKTG